MAANPLLEDLHKTISEDTSPIVSVALPSMGRWYPEGVFVEGADPGDLEVKSLGIIAEHNYKDPWLLISGQAIPRLIRAACPTVEKPEELFEVDIDAILVAARIASYGQMMDLTHNCYNMVDNPDYIEGEKPKKGETPQLSKKECGQENNLDVDLYQFIQRYSPLENFDEYMVQIPGAKQIVHLRPVPYKDTMHALKKTMGVQRFYDAFDNVQDAMEMMLSDDEKSKQYAEIVDQTEDVKIDTLLASIHSVEMSTGDRIGDRGVIREWLIAITPEMFEEIENLVTALRKKLLKIPIIEYQCSECGAVNEFSLQMDPQRLFMKAGDSKAPKKPSQESKGTEKPQKRPSATSRRSPTRTKARSSTKT